MEKQFEIYSDTKVTYEETEEKKQKVWDALITWYKEHNCTCGEGLMQNDDCQIDAPIILSDIVDDIIQFKTSDDN